MTIRIDEVVTEVTDEAPARRGDGSEGAGAASPVGDLDRIERELERHRQRLARLWAD